MTPYDPTQPQPGDWEAALTAIEAAEARADALRRWRKWGGWGAAAAVATAVLWFGVRSEDASSSASNTPIERPAQVEALAPVESAEQAAENFHATSLESPSLREEDLAPAAEQVERPHAEPQPGRKGQPMASTSDVVSHTGHEHVRQRSSTAEVEASPSLRATAENSNTEVTASTLKEEVVEAPGATVQPEPTLGEFAASGAVSGLSALIPRSPTPAWHGAAGPELQATPATEVARPPHAWGALLSWEGGEWAAALTREVQEGWFVRLGGVWDGRHRKWVATPVRDVFGALQTPRSVLSDQAIWASAGMEYRRHLKGRWGAVGRVDAQYLFARHLVEGQWGAGEQIVAGSAAAWGQLKEESPWRLGWGAGCDWSVSEAHALRMTVGGFWSPTPTYDYIDWTEGLPRTAGELRLTWLWK